MLRVVSILHLLPWSDVDVIFWLTAVAVPGLLFCHVLRKKEVWFKQVKEVVDLVVLKISSKDSWW